MVLGYPYLNPFEKFNKVLLITTNFIVFIAMYVYLVADQVQKDKIIANYHKPTKDKKKKKKIDIMKAVTHIHVNY